MKKIVFALFQSWPQAHFAIQALHKIGYVRHALRVTTKKDHILVTVDTGDMGEDIVSKTLQDHGAYETRVHDPHHEKIAA